MHSQPIATYIKYKFNEIPSFGYLIMSLMAEDRNQMDGRADRQHQTYIPPPLAGITKR